MSSSAVRLGISDLTVFPELAESDAWGNFAKTFQGKAFLNSEGLSVPLGTPHTLQGQLLEQTRNLAHHAHRFYRDVVDAYYERPELREQFLVNPAFAALFEADRESSTIPLSRMDAVLTSDGKLSMIEINPVGVCLIHMRNVLYMVRALDRRGYKDCATLLDSVATEMCEAFRRHYLQRHERLPAKPVIGLLHPRRALRADRLLMRGAFERNGWKYVSGCPDELEVSAEGLSLGGERLDLLWTDFLFYMAYQHSRYRQTRFRSKMADMSRTPALAAELLANPLFVEHLRTGRCVGVSTGRSYLALSKSLLAWAHRDDRPVSAESRDWLRDHLARTYSYWEREDGSVTKSELLAAKDQLVLKPCQYGGSHGVLIGEESSEQEWSSRIDETWEDPNWILQEYHRPATTPDGAYVSLGIHNFEGTMGGVTVRVAGAQIVGARDSMFIPVAHQ